LMILGNNCTRACRFCNVPTGYVKKPRKEEHYRIGRHVYSYCQGSSRLWIRLTNNYLYLDS
jgi:hypothetical protein